MEKTLKDDTLRHEVSVKYVNFRRDTFVVGISSFALIMIIGLIIKMGWLFGISMGLLAMIAVIGDSIFTRQLFKISFQDREGKIQLLYSIYMTIKSRESFYKDLSYHVVHNDNNKIQLKIYIKGNLWIVADKNKYGWTDGLVQETARMFAYRDVKCIK